MLLLPVPKANSYEFLSRSVLRFIRSFVKKWSTVAKLELSLRNSAVKFGSNLMYVAKSTNLSLFTVIKRNWVPLRYNEFMIFY